MCCLHGVMGAQSMPALPNLALPMKRNIINTPTTQPTPEAEPNRREAFREAFRKYHVFLVDYFRRRVSDEHTACGLTQELWRYVWIHFATLDFDDPVKIRCKAYQIFVAYLRHKRVRSNVEFTDNVPDVESGNQYAEPQSPAEEETFTRAFWELFPGIHLTNEQRQAFFLKHRCYYTYEEIATLMNVPPSTVHVWVSTVITKCQRHFNRELL
jgi:RNA polymerase sigma factor (sigma-70 family)